MNDETKFRDIGDWLYSKRMARRWSQADVARKADLSQPAISNIERKVSRNPHKRTREKLANIFDEAMPKELVIQVEKEQEIVGLPALIDFDPHASQLPDCHGIYTFYDSTQRLVYVGKASTETIAQRIGQQSGEWWFNRPLVDHASYIEIQDSKLCEQVEQILVRVLKSNALLNVQHTEVG